MRYMVFALALYSFACGTPDDSLPDANPGSMAGSAPAAGGASSGQGGGAATAGQPAQGGNAGATSSGAGSSNGGSTAAGAGGGSSGGGNSGGGSGEAGAVGTAGASGDYNPCPPQGTPCKVMPLGDSITVGAGGGWTGYRIPVFQHTLDAAQLLSYVGSQTDGPDTHDGVPFPKGHEGHGGYTIAAGGGRAGIQELIVGVLEEYQPHIVLMMIGTNDVDLHLEDLPTKLGTLMDSITETDPGALLVAAKIVPSTDDAQNADIETYNASFDALVAARVADGKHIVTVDMYAAFTENSNFKTEYMNDELHPNNAGYEVMAETWYAAIGPLLR